MSIKMLAVAVVAALVACVSGAFTSDGSSAAANCIIAAGKKYGVTYLAGGTGAGQAFITAKKGPVAFGDEPFAAGTLPAYVKQFPVATGSIVVYRNTGMPRQLGNMQAPMPHSHPTWDRTTDPGPPQIKAVAFTTKQLCDLFSNKVNTYTTIGRSDSSGSTTVFRNYLASKCPGFVLKADKLCAGTSGVIACLKSTPNSITYASCGQSAVEASVDGKFCKVAKGLYPISYKLYAYAYAADPNSRQATSLTNDIKAGVCAPQFYYGL